MVFSSSSLSDAVLTDTQDLRWVRGGSAPLSALLVSEDAALAETIRRALEPRGWEVVVADGGSLAAVSSRVGFPLVVVDGQLADTVASCRRARAAAGEGATCLLVVGHEELPAEVAPDYDDLLPRAAGEARGLARVAEHRLLAAAAAAEAGALRAALDEVQTSLAVQKIFFEKLFESAPDGIAVVAADDRILRTNAEFCRMFGFEPDEVLGRNLNALIAPGPYSAEARAVAETVRRGEPVALETVRCRKDGTVLEVALLATPIPIERDQVAVFGIYRDLTRFKTAERALRERERELKTLVEHTPDIIARFDRSFRHLFVNPAIERATGLAASELIGKTSEEAGMPPEMVAEWRAALESVFQSGTDRQLELDLPTPLGPRRFLTHLVPEVSGDDRVESLLGVSRDITELRNAAQRLHEQARELERVNATLQERTGELEAALQARSRLYVAMNHELRTPISAIMLYNDLLLAGAMGALSEPQRESLAHAQRAAQHLLELVQDVLDLSRLEAGKLSIIRESVSVPRLIQELITTVRPLAERHGSELSFASIRTDWWIETDPRRLRQILLNLLSNAVKFGEGQPIRVSCEPTAEGGACITVSDRGRGIAPEDLLRIFEEFVQVGQHQGSGTGLGLAISLRLVKLLGGSIDAHSEIGAGSSFRVVLPAATPGTESALHFAVTL